MDFLPKELEDIIVDYKNQLDQSEHREKMKSTLFSIANLDIEGGYFFSKWINTYYLIEEDTNKFIVRTETTFQKGMRFNIDL